MRALPIFQIEDNTVVTHTGALVGQWRWLLAWPDHEKHWWNERVWWCR